MVSTGLASCCQVEVTNLRTTACNFLIEVLAFALAEFLRLTLKYIEDSKRMFISQPLMVHHQPQCLITCLKTTTTTK